jgi:hypothetical protein
MDAINDDDLAALVAAANAGLAWTSPADGPLLEVSFEALAYMLRSGPEALSRPEVINKLTRCDQEQAIEIVARLTRRSESNSTPWTPEQIRKLRNTAKEAMKL